MKKRVIILSFSSRKGGNCEQIAEYISTLVNDSVKKYRFADFCIHPCGGCNYECFTNPELCPFKEDMEIQLLRQISAADAAYFVVPNYCDHPCANFYIYNERSNCWFQNHPARLEQYLKVRKKFIVISSTQGESFQRAFEQHTEDEPRILYLSAKKYGLRSSADDFLQSDDAKAEIQEFLKIRPEGALRPEQAFGAPLL